MYLEKAISKHVRIRSEWAKALKADARANETTQALTLDRILAKTYGKKKVTAKKKTTSKKK